MPSTSSFDYNAGWDAKWDDMKKYGPISRHVRRIVKSLVASLEFDSVVDVGCGQGSLLAELNSYFPGKKLYGVDVSSSAIESATQKVPEAQFFILDLEQSHSRADKRYDLVICCDVIEHIQNDDLALKNLANLTCKYLLVSTLQGRMRKFEEQEVGHVRNYERGEVVRKLEMVGLRTLEVVEWGFPLYSPLYRNFLEITGSRGTTGKFGLFRRFVSTVLYYLFLLNSSKRGDQIFILAKIAE